MKIILKSKHSIIKKGGEKRMKYSKVIFAFSIGILVIAAMAFLSNTWAVEDVRNTKHNLSANPNIGANQPEVCVFCHTPHGGDTDVGGSTNAAPLWNRAAINTQGYADKMYISPNFDGYKDADLTGNYPYGVSAACLSCHDGTVAFDALINAPGTGEYDPAAPRRNYQFSGGYVNGDGTFKEGVYPPDPMPNLTQDLRNDHPISIRMCDTAQTPTNDPQFTDTCTNSIAQTNNFILKLKRSLGDAAVTADIRDQVRAYRTAGSEGGWYVECASCHNPHEASRKNDPEYNPITTSQASSGITYSNTENDRFLRFPSFDPTAQPASVKDALLTGDRNAGSLLCLTCHQK